MLAGMYRWWPPGPISAGLTLAAIAAWLLWLRDRILFGAWSDQADLVLIAIAGVVGAVIAYAIERGSGRAPAQSTRAATSPEGELEPYALLSRAHVTLDRLNRHAVEEAQALRHNYVGSEHLLLGALRMDVPATRSVQRFGVSLGTQRGRSARAAWRRRGGDPRRHAEGQGDLPVRDAERA